MRVLATCSGMALLWSGSALAQDETSATTPTPEVQVGIDDIVVTATRRSENLQTIGGTVSAVTSEDLAQRNITRTEDLVKGVPSLQVDNTAGYVMLYIRGVGTYFSSAYADSAVALSYDGVYVSRTAGTNGFFFDIDRVEVLEGPQGTLYGRNATGGAVNIIPRAPRNAWDFGGAVRVGNYGLLSAEGFVNAPVGNGGFRASFQRVRHDGYFKDGTGNQDDWSGRLQLAGDLTDKLSFHLDADYSHQKGAMGGALLPFNDDARDGISSPSARARLAALGLPPLPPGSRTTKLGGVSGTVNWDNPLGTLTAIAAYRETTLKALDTSPSFLSYLTEDDDQTSVEVRLASRTGGLIDYLVGGYYFDETVRATQNYNLGSSNNLQSFTNPTTSYAVFGNLTIHPLPALRVLLGARQTWDQKRSIGTVTNLLNGAVVNTTGSRDFKKFTWKAGIEWDVADRSLLYANVATGYKAGGFFAAAAPNVFLPETITAYSVGSKNRFFDNKVQLNGELFYWRYKNQQINILSVRPSGAGFTTFAPTLNVGTSTIKGAVVSALIMPGDGLRLEASAQYLDAKYDTFQYSALRAGNFAVGCASTNGQAGPLPVLNVDCAGHVIPKSPKWTLSGAVTKTIALGNAGEIEGSVSASYRTGQWLNVKFLPEQFQQSYGLLDASLTYRPAGSWAIMAFASNITDKVAATSATANPLFKVIGASLIPPRTFGVRVSYNY